MIMLPDKRFSLWTVRSAFAVPAVVFFSLAIIFLVRLGAGDVSQVPSVLIGNLAPPTELPSLPGLSTGTLPVPGLSKDRFTGSRITFVNVWSSWCVPCREEHPVLMDLAQQGKVRLIGINYKDNAENARRFLGSLGNPFSAIGFDEKGQSAINWGVYGVPETFVLDEKGVVRGRHIGPLTAEDLVTLEHQVTSLNPDGSTLAKTASTFH